MSATVLAEVNGRGPSRFPAEDAIDHARGPGFFPLRLGRG